MAVETNVAPFFSPGARIADRYQVVELLGRGGMAEVYRVVDAGGGAFAMKVLPHDDSPGGDDFAERFAREGEIARRLRHPACATVHEVGRAAGGSRFIVMDLVRGPTLRAVIDEPGRFPPARAHRVAMEVLDALAHAHALDVVHRDVKPANVMFTRDDRDAPIAVIDFGLARVLGDAALTALGKCVGSPSYIAPERLLGRHYDARADIYSVGVMLYEMLADQRPFVGATPLAIANQHITAAPPPLSAAGVQVPAELERVVMIALAKNPGDRYPTAADMRFALARVDPAPAPSRWARLVRKLAP